MNMTVTSGRKSLLPVRLRTTTTDSSPPTSPMPSIADNKTKSDLLVGNRVLVNGIKPGILRYVGQVKFAQGDFCGVELDQPEGKHDGQVQNIRYFQCTMNHGIFVPRDKVILEPRARPSSTQRPISRLKPPTIARSVTHNSSLNTIEQLKSAPLPDIIPNSNSTPVTSPIQVEKVQPDSSSQLNTNEPITTAEHSSNLIDVESPKVETLEMTSMPIAAPVLMIDESDFSASVSLILHQLQQEQVAISTRASSINLSDDETEDDGTDDESLAESIVQEKVEIIRPPEIPVVQINNPLSQISKARQPTTPVVPQTKLVKPNKVLPVNPVRKPMIAPVKKTNNITTQRTSSQSKLNSSLSSLNSSHSDIRSVKKVSATTKRPNDENRRLAQSHEAQLQEQKQYFIEQLKKQQETIVALTANNQLVKNEYANLRDRFDVINIVTQFYLEQIDLNQEKNRQGFSKVLVQNENLKILLEQNRSIHEKELTDVKSTFELEINALDKSHQEQLQQLQEEFQILTNKKNEFEQRCATLQEKVDSFFGEMASGEQGDTVVRYVKALEKDRTSLQCVLEMKTHEISQLRTKVDEQTLQLEEKAALKKNIEILKTQNQSLTYSLRRKLLEEKAVFIRQDQYEEDIARLERENRRLKFENENLLYRLNQSRPKTILVEPKTTTPRPATPKKRSRSFSSSTNSLSQYESLKRFSSLNILVFR